jgi:hypothetical protein
MDSRDRVKTARHKLIVAINDFIDSGAACSLESLQRALQLRDDAMLPYIEVRKTDEEPTKV